MEIKGSPAGLLAVPVVAGAIFAFAYLLGIPEAFGISLRFGWGAVNSGHTVVRALTPKIASVQSRDIFLARGEELTATYDFRLDSGRAWLSVYTWGWMPGVGPMETFHRDSAIRQPTRREIRVLAPQSGFYTISGMIVDATGTFSIDWRVARASGQGQVMRALRFAFGFIPLLMIAIVVLALLVAGARAVFD